MNPNTSNDDILKNEPLAASHPRPWRQKILAVVIPFLIIGAGIAGASYLIKTSPKASRKPPKKTIPLVSVTPIRFGNEPITVPAMGTVVPTRKIELKTSVSGEVIWVHPAFCEGGHLKKGEIILKIDPSDYRLGMIEQKAQVAQAKYALALELGHQEVARREWDLISKGKSVTQADQDLALRKPHLQKAKADLEAAEALLTQERRNLERTLIKAPFNAMVSDIKVDVGSNLAAQTTLATLTGTDRYWVKVSIPTDRLKWITIPNRKDQTGSKVTIYQGNNHHNSQTREGNVVRLMGDLDPQGRMARVLVAVDDPLNLAYNLKKRQPLFMGAFVQADLIGKEVSQVARLARSNLHADNTVWVMTKEGTLSIRTVSILFRDPESVLVKQGILAGEQLIVSNLPAPVDGMQVRAEKAPLVSQLQKEKKAS
jgi:RND family efflux transporter MFP subunit